MNTKGKILVIEDDEDDRDVMDMLIRQVLEEDEYTNEVAFFASGNEAYNYLLSLNERPFLVVSDINMPGMDGFELREKIFNDERLRSLCIPYIFLTTSGYNREVVEKAYKLSVQGYFQKPNSAKHLKVMIKTWVSYWKNAITA